MSKKIFAVFVILLTIVSCNKMEKVNEVIYIQMHETQLTFSTKNHALDNNDNFPLTVNIYATIQEQRFTMKI